MTLNEAQSRLTGSLVSERNAAGEEEVDADGEDAELEKLQWEVEHMAQKILEYRSKLPNQLKITVSSLLASHRPVMPAVDPASEAGSSASEDPSSDARGDAESDQGALLVDRDKEAPENIHSLKRKISSNISSMPALLKRMNECISKIDNFSSQEGTIHPAFAKKSTN